MPAAQHLLFPDPRPLVERLGRGFFTGLPADPGVYLMRDAADTVLYVGKARNLRRRLTAYRVANPDRMARRHLRLLRQVVRVELQVCTDETAALVREAELLRLLKPRFNRAGTWAPPLRQLVWRCEHAELVLASREVIEPGWHGCGTSRGGGRWVKAALVRLLWFALNPAAGICRMPPGWAHGQMPEPTPINCADLAEEVRAVLNRLSSGDAATFCSWVEDRWAACAHPAFDGSFLQQDLEVIRRSMSPPM